MPRKKLCSGRKCASRGPKQSPAKQICLGEEGQGNGAMPSRQAGMSGADFAPTKCDAAACIPFEKMLAFLREAVDFVDSLTP